MISPYPLIIKLRGAIFGGIRYLNNRVPLVVPLQICYIPGRYFTTTIEETRKKYHKPRILKAEKPNMDFINYKCCVFSMNNCPCNLQKKESVSGISLDLSIILKQKVEQAILVS